MWSKDVWCWAADFLNWIFQRSPVHQKLRAAHVKEQSSPCQNKMHVVKWREERSSQGGERLLTWWCSSMWLSSQDVSVVSSQDVSDQLITDWVLRPWLIGNNQTVKSWWDIYFPFLTISIFTILFRSCPNAVPSPRKGFFVFSEHHCLVEKAAHQGSIELDGDKQANCFLCERGSFPLFPSLLFPSSRPDKEGLVWAWVWGREESLTRLRLEGRGWWRVCASVCEDTRIR